LLVNTPSIPILFRGFIMKMYWILSKTFFCINWEDLIVFTLASVYMLYCVYGFMLVEPSLHPWNQINLVMLYDLFDLLNSVC
jgi:hypothetical protein